MILKVVLLHLAVVCGTSFAQNVQASSVGGVASGLRRSNTNLNIGQPTTRNAEYYPNGVVRHSNNGDFVDDGLVTFEDYYQPDDFRNIRNNNGPPFFGGKYRSNQPVKNSYVLSATSSATPSYSSTEMNNNYERQSNNNYLRTYFNRVSYYVQQPRVQPCCSNRVAIEDGGRIFFPSNTNSDNEFRTGYSERRKFQTNTANNNNNNIPIVIETAILSDEPQSSNIPISVQKQQEEKGNVENTTAIISSNPEEIAVNIIQTKPSKCVWAIISCCSPKSNEVRHQCFELLGCTGAIWDANPCDTRITEQAAQAALDFYNKG